MTKPIRFLFTSVGRRVELLRHFIQWAEKNPGRLEIFGTEIDRYAPAAQLLGQRVHLVPRVGDPEYVPAIAALCADLSVDSVFPLIDPDVSVLGGEGGIPLASVSGHAAEMVSDKWLTAHWLAANKIPAPRTWLPEETGEGGWPVFMKPRRGSGAVDTFAVRSRREHDFFAEYIDAPIVQELLPGPEVTVDVIVGRDGALLGLAQRCRLAVRGGEVSRGALVRDPKVTHVVEDLIGALGPRGPVTVQGMYGDDGAFLVTEVNARMGGGLPLAMAAGMPVAELLVRSWAGEEPSRVDPDDVGLHMVRFDDAFFYHA